MDEGWWNARLRYSRPGYIGMKILYYNWIPFDNAKRVGGGVQVYQKNLIEEMIESPENEVYFLSSGWKYNPMRRVSYIRESINILKDKVKSFEIINSPIMAPAYTNFNNIKIFLYDETTLKIFTKFINEYGPFDVIHLNNIEGISINILKIKEKYPKTKLVLSLHNYIPFCPLVQYFQNHNARICTDFDNGRECLKCPEFKIGNKEYIRHVQHYFRDKLRVKFIANIFSWVFIFNSNKFITKKNVSTHSDFALYRKKNIEYINKYVDQVLTVSKRVREIAINNGIDKNIVRTSYIGTKVAANQNRERKNITNLNSIPFVIAYLGYAKIDKGFYFLISVLEMLKKNIAKRIKVKIAVNDMPKGYLSKLHKKLKDFAQIKNLGGYSHQELPTILSDVDLGIIPVLWEDNLPQVAIEMVACGVPILCSDFGGASELCKSDVFKFKGGSQKDCIEKLTAIVENQNLLQEYWNHHNGLTTMKEHLAELKNNYLELSLKERFQAKPKFKEIRLEFTNACAYNCYICPHNLMERKVGYISQEGIEILAKNIPYAHEIELIDLHGFGEAILDKDLFKKAGVVRKLFPNAEIRIITTLGYKLGDKFWEELFSSDISTVWISFYGANKENYKKIHGVDHFELALGNLKKFITLQKEKGKLDYKITLNYHNAFPGMELKDNDILSEILKKDLVGLGAGECKFGEINLHNHGKYIDLIKCRNKYPCSVIFGRHKTILNITWDLDIIACSFVIDAEIYFGNLKEKTLDEIFTSEVYKNFVDAHLSGKLEEYPNCQGCQRMVIATKFEKSCMEDYLKIINQAE